MTVPYIQDVNVRDIASIEKAFEAVQEYKVTNNNWPDQYPDTPEFSFRIFHTGEYMVVKYIVTENSTLALVGEDMGPVWTDSCAEFFIQPGGEGNYYNLEATCIGRILLANRPGRTGKVDAGVEVLRGILRYPSFGTHTFAEKKGPNRWTLILAVPATALFKDNLSTWRGLHARFNVYKCGDNLTQPHYLSYSAIKTPGPDFHRPEFFTDIDFE